MIDNFKHKGLRKQLVQTIKAKGITDDKVLEAVRNVPRHFFFDSSFLEHAYADNPFPIGFGQTISQPYTVAYQTELLQIKKGDKVLEIGTGSGYQACILNVMGAKVFSIERQKGLYIKTKALLSELGYSIKLFFGDGYKGLPTFSPFDKIIITAAAPYLPQALIDQLKPGGLMVVPLGKGSVQTMTTIIKKSDDEYETVEYGDFRFVPLLEDKVNG